MKLSWLGGFLSGQNSVLATIGGTPNILDGTDLAGAVGWIDNYCLANPLQNLSTAAEKLSAELLGRINKR